MSLIVGTNTFVSLSDANTYFDGRLYATDWDNATDTEKEGALIEATIHLNQLDYYGERADTTTPQALKFPRANLPYIDGYQPSDSEIPTEIKNATCEEALAILKNDPLSLKSIDEYESVKLGDINVSYRDILRDRTRTFVRGYLKGYLMSNGQASLIHT